MCYYAWNNVQYDPAPPPSPRRERRRCGGCLRRPPPSPAPIPAAVFAEAKWARYCEGSEELAEWARHFVEDNYDLGEELAEWEQHLAEDMASTATPGVCDVQKGQAAWVRDSVEDVEPATAPGDDDASKELVEWERLRRERRAGRVGARLG